MPVAQWALNAAYREKLKSVPYKGMFGREPETSFSMLLEFSENDWEAMRLDSDRVSKLTAALEQEQATLHEKVLSWVRDNRERMRMSESPGHTAKF